MIHEDLGLVRRSAMKSRKHGGENMIRRAQWVVLALLSLALAFGTGCTSNTASAPPTQVITITATGAYAQDTTLDTQYAAPFTVLVTTSTPPSTTQTPVGAGVVVTFTAPTSGAGGTFSNGQTFYSTTTDASGIAVSSAFTTPTPPATPTLVNPFTANGTVGTYNVIAASPSTESTATFFLSNTLVPAPAGTTVAGGSPQSTPVSTQFATLSVTVKDGSTPAKPVSNIPVTFTAPAFTIDATTGLPTTSSGTFADTATYTTTAITNSSGVATAAAFTANALPDVLPASGPYNVTAETPLGASSATFLLSNTTVPISITPTALSATQDTPANDAFPVALAVIVLDAKGNPVTNAFVTFTAPAQPAAPAAAVPSGTFADSGTNTTTAWTDATGTATAATFTANAVSSPAGPPVVPYNVTASVVISNTATLSTNSETPTQNFVLTND
jgi:hypothetical protein